MTIGKRLRNLRIERKLTQERLEALSGVSQEVISRIETGDRWEGEGRPNAKIIAELEDALAVPPGTLQGRNRQWGVPILSKMSAGDPKEYTDGEFPPGFAEHYAPRPPDILDPNAFAFEIEGESMLPKLEPGTVVYCSPRLAVQDGDIAVVRIANNQETACKVWRRKGDKIILWPLNPDFQPQEYEEGEIVWAYPVVGDYHPRRRR